MSSSVARVGVVAALVVLVVAVAHSPALAFPSPRGRGAQTTLVLAGGEVDDNNTAIYGPMVAGAGGTSAVVAVMTAASGDPCCDPDSSWVLYNSIFQSYNVSQVIWIPIDPQHIANNRNPAVLHNLSISTLFFFSGGDQV